MIGDHVLTTPDQKAKSTSRVGRRTRHNDDDLDQCREDIIKTVRVAVRIRTGNLDGHETSAGHDRISSPGRPGQAGRYTPSLRLSQVFHPAQGM